MEGEDLAITVLTCEGDIKDPTFPFKLQRLVAKLQNLISDEENPIKVTKVEPWNSVRVTFNIPLEAAQRLRQLAERGDRVLRELGILSVQVEGDQVITLTLASQYSEPQEIVLRKTSDEQGDVASVSFNLPNPDSVPGPSTAEPAHKNITQFLGHIVGGASSSSSNASPSGRLEKSASPKTDTLLSFRSPNVIAPTSTDPIPFPPSTAITTTASLPSSSRVSPNVSLKSPGFGPFPFASMTHAMNTKNSTSPQYQPVLHVQGGNPRLLSPSSHLTNAILGSAAGSIATASTSKTSNAALQKVSRTIANSAFSSVVSRTVISPNAIASTSRANVALSSPLLVNLLQSETSNLQQNNKLMPPPSQISNEAPKKKRKPRKVKEKSSDNSLSPNFSTSPSPPLYQSHAGVRSPGSFDHMSVLGPSLNVPMSAVSPPASQIANIHPMAQGQPPVSTLKSQTQTIHPSPQGLSPVSLPSQVQGQPMVSTTRPLGHQTISAFRQTQGHRAVPNIHPQAQGQPQVHTGNLPLHTHIPVGSPHVSRPSVGSSQSYAMSAPRTIPTNPTRSMFVSREPSLLKSLDKTKESTTLKSDRTSAPSTPSTSTPDSNPFPSPPSSSDGKTKHLINPFTGQLEPMPSDEEEEEESIGSLPPFPEFENDTSEKSQSERSLSDGGKDNNLSSDTDSGISKSITDVSQSSTECLTADTGKESKKAENSNKTDSVPTASVTSSVPGEKLKLRLKIDSKSIRESKDVEMKEKRAKDLNTTLNQKIDVSVVNIPGMKKSVTSSTTSVPEPRVPPLHISLRGPNAAVVVSPRKDDSKSRHSSSKEDHSVGDVVIKGVPKKVRSPRAARTGEAASTIAMSLTGRTIESLDKKVKTNNPKDFRKTKDELWNPSAKMAMSGGGIVEVSDKLSSSRVSSYDSYLTSATMGSTIVQHKSPNIFSLASRESCKQEVMTLTSCSTGESVTLHSFVEKSPLSAVSETEVANPSLVVKNEVSCNVSSLVIPTERRVPESNSDSDSKISCDDSEVLSSSKNAPLMQNNNNLPQSPSAPLDSKNNVQNSSSCLNNQILSQQFASCLNNVDSTVPLSSTSSVSLPVCKDTIETASDVNGQEVQAGDNTTDAKTTSLDQHCSGVAAPAEGVINLIDNHKLQISQCNTTQPHSSTHNSPETVDDSVNIDKNVQIELISSQTAEVVCTENVVEVQKTIVNKIDTANKESSETTLSSDNSANCEITRHSLTPKQLLVEDDDKFKAFSNNLDATCNLAVSCSTLVPKATEISRVIASDKNMCSVDVKDSSPAAQIITTTVTNSPSHSHVIEVPSMQNLQPALSKSEQSIEVNFKSSASPLGADECIRATNVPVMKETQVCEGSFSSTSATLSSCNPDKLSNHVNKTMPLNVKENVNIYVKEELKMDPVEEDRKRCMLLSEVPTSTPGPPPSFLDFSTPKQDDLCSELSKPVSVIQSVEIKKDDNSSKKIENSDEEIKAPAPKQISSIIVSPKRSETKPDSTVTSDIHIQLPSANKPPIKKESDSSERRAPPSMSTANFPQSVSITRTQNMPDPAPSFLFSTLVSAPSTNSIDAGTSLETKLTPKAEVLKKEVPSEPVHIVSSSGNTLVTSLLSPVKYLNNEVSSQKFKLIFKGSSQRTALPGGNASGSLVVPLNSSKVPIKLVALQGGASALSVRSTSNPNIVEIIGPKTAQNSVSNNPHISSPVRFVVSKMSPGMSCTTSGNSSNMRNRVVVKSVVVTSTSPSIKLLSANSLSTSLSLNSGVTSTSTIIQSIPSTATSNSIMVENTSTIPEDSKVVVSAETAVQSSLNLQEQIATVSINSNIDSMTKSVPVLNASCSSSADSTTKKSCLNITDTKSSESNSGAADSSVKLTVPPDNTSVCVTSSVETITSSCNGSKKENVIHTETVSSVINSKLSNNDKCDKRTDIEKSAADTNSESIDNKAPFVKSVGHETNKPSSSNSETSNSKNVAESDVKSIVTKPEAKDTSSAVSGDSKSVEQTANSAIITSSKYISNNLEPPDIAGSSVNTKTQHLSLENSAKDSKLKLDPTHLVNSESADNHLSVPSQKHFNTGKTEVMVSNDTSVDILFENDKGLSNSLSENSVDSVPSIVDKEEVIETVDTDSLDTTSSNDMQKFRPLGEEESASLSDHTEIEDAKVVVEDSQLEISLVYSKPLKRKCSENAAELIKACMGVEDGPKRGVILKPKACEDVAEETDEINDKVEENVRMSLRIRRDDPLHPLPKKAKGPTLNSDCSTDEEIAISELATKSRTRDRPTRGHNSNRDSPVEPNHCRPKRRRSGSNESRNSHTEEIKIRTPREGKRESIKKDEPTKKLPERTKRGTYKVSQDQVVVSKLGVQRSSRIREQEVKANNIKEESNSLGVKRKTRNTSESQEMLVAVKRRRYSKDGHR